jgi:excisionase family DNA binding protein
VILAVLDEVTRSHLLAAVTAHVTKLRRDGMPVPVSVREVVETLATDGHTRPTFDDPLSDLDGDPMDVLAYSYRGAGARLGISDRSVRRLVREGHLSAVDIGGCRRIRARDLRAFVDGLHPVSEEAAA